MQYHNFKISVDGTCFSIRVWIQHCSLFFYYPAPFVAVCASCLCVWNFFVCSRRGKVVLLRCFFPRSWPSIFVRCRLHYFSSASYACYCTYGMYGSKGGGLQMHSVGWLAGSCVTWDGARVVTVFFYLSLDCSPYRPFVAGCSLSTTSPTFVGLSVCSALPSLACAHKR